MVDGLLRVILVVVGVSISLLAASARDALALTASSSIASGLFLWSWSTSLSLTLSISLGQSAHVSLRACVRLLFLLVGLVVGAVDPGLISSSCADIVGRSLLLSVSLVSSFRLPILNLMLDIFNSLHLNTLFLQVLVVVLFLVSVLGVVFVSS